MFRESTKLWLLHFTYLFQFLLKAAEFLNSCCDSRMNSAFSSSGCQYYPWGYVSKTRLLALPISHNFGGHFFVSFWFLVFVGFWFLFESGVMHLTVKTFTISTLNCFACEKDAILFLCLMVTFQFHLLSIFSKGNGGWKMPFQFDHCSSE